MKKQPSALIANLLNKKSQPIPIARTEDVVVMRDAREILTNPKNERYNMKAIEELAAMIQLTHNIEPVTVKELPNGSFMLTSGHRRRLAQLYRFEHGMVETPMLPTIVREIVNDFSEIITDDEMETLNVVFPNRGQRRELTASEEAAEIDMIRPILYKIYEHEKSIGNVQGKFRTFFAEVLGISETTLQRKESINRVSEEIKAEMDSGTIKPTAAAALANMDREMQNQVVQSIKGKGEEVTVKAVKQAKQEISESKEMEDNVPFDTSEDAEQEMAAYIVESPTQQMSENMESGDDTGELAALQEAQHWIQWKVRCLLQETEDRLEYLKKNHCMGEVPLWEAKVRIICDTLDFLDSREGNGK